MTEQTIKNIVEEYYSIQITNTVRKRNYVEARAIYFTLVRKYTRLSLEAIGKTVNKHHASVLHCVKELKEWVKYDSRVRSDYEYLASKISLLTNEEQEQNLNDIELVLLRNNSLKSELEKAKQKNLDLALQLKDVTSKYITQRDKAEKYYLKKYGLV